MIQTTTTSLQRNYSIRALVASPGSQSISLTTRGITPTRYRLITTGTHTKIPTPLAPPEMSQQVPMKTTLTADTLRGFKIQETIEIKSTTTTTMARDLTRIDNTKITGTTRETKRRVAIVKEAKSSSRGSLARWVSSASSTPLGSHRQTSSGN